MGGAVKTQKVENICMLNTTKNKEQNTYLSIFGWACFFFDHLLCILCYFKLIEVQTVLSGPIIAVLWSNT